MFNEQAEYPRCDSNAQPLAPEANAQATYNQQNQGLKENRKPHLSTSLDKILQKYPDLAELVKIWSKLPEHIKKAITALVKSARAQE